MLAQACDPESDSDATGSTAPPQRAPSMCGTFGCQLPDKHAGLHQIPNVEAHGRAAPRKRQRAQQHNMSVEPVQQRRRTPAARAAQRWLGTSLINRRVSVWWEAEGRNFSGTVKAFDVVSGRHLVVYDDGDHRHEAFNDGETRWSVLDVPQQPPPTAASVAMAEGASRPKLLARPGATSRRAHSRVGDEYQAPAVALHVPSVAPPPAPPPVCRCGVPALWQRARWWCALGEHGCGYEAIPPPGLPSTPLCACGVAAVWVRNHFWCARCDNGAAGCPKPSARDGGDGGAAYGCGFMARTEIERPSPQRIASTEIEISLAQRTAATLTAAAYGAAGALAFVGAADCGGGLFARVALPTGTIVGEYGGPRLHISQLEEGKGSYALEVPGSHHFVDGHHDHSPFGRRSGRLGGRHVACGSSPPLHMAIFANHSSEPNARLERRANPTPGPLDLK